MRIILFTGKGGVGKTTIAAATAWKTAKMGYKTLIISTDPAHSLSDALDTQLGPEPTEIQLNLYAQELDVYYSMQKYWRHIRELMLTVFKWQGIKHVLAEEMSALPGMEEASAFLWIEKYYTEDAFDVIIIDSAPTGETLTLLTLPQVTKWWVTKALPLQSFAIRSFGKVARITTGIPIDKGYEELQKIFDKLEKVQKIFSDADICSIRMVTNPEKMVLNESKRAFTYLSLYGYNTDSIIINRIIKENQASEGFERYLETQKKYLEEIRDIFSEIPLFNVHHFGGEVFGLDSLAKIADETYGDNDPVAVFHKDMPYRFKKSDEGFVLSIKLPFIKANRFTVNKYGDEIVIQIGNKRKNIFLPRFVNFYQLESFRYDDPWLIVNLTD